MEPLETRRLLSAVHWINPSGGAWSVASNWSNDAVPTSSDDVTIAGTTTFTVALDENAEVHSLNLGGAAGTQTLSDVSQTLTLDSASAINSNGALAVAIDHNGDPVLVAGASTLTNSGTIAISAQTFPGDTPPTATIGLPLVNDGTINVSGNSVGDSAQLSSLTLNSGSIVDTSAGSLTLFMISNQGTIDDAQGGVLSIMVGGGHVSGPGSVNTGDINLPNGVQCNVTGALDEQGSFTNDGTIGGTGLNLALDDVDATLDSPVVGTLATANSNLYFGAGVSTTQTSILCGASVSISGQGTLTVGQGQTLTLSATDNVSIPLVNDGTINVIGVGANVGGTELTFISLGLTTGNASVINLIADDANGNATLIIEGGYFTNTAAINFINNSNEGFTPQLYIGDYSDNPDPFTNAAGGTITARGFGNGSLSVASQINADLVNAGTLTQSYAAGLAISGNYTQQSSGTLEIGIPGPTPDTLTIAGNATFAGTLTPVLQNQYVSPPISQSFDAVSFPASTGTFTLVATQDVAFTAAYDPTMLSLTPGTFSPVGYFTANQDIGGPAIAGYSSYNGSIYTVTGAGSDISNGAEQFQYVYEPVTGNATITAEVTAQSDTDPFAKAGLIFMNTLDTSSAFAAALITPSNGVVFENRPSTAGAIVLASSASTSIAAPYYLQLVRAGDVFTAYVSPDGTTWTQVGDAQTIAANSTMYVGLAVSSHNTAALSAATFANVSVNAPSLVPTVTANGQSYGLDENSDIVIAAPGLLAGDSDSDGGSLTVSLVAGSFEGAGSLTLDSNGDGGFVFFSGTFVGGASFNIKVTDDNDPSAYATALVSIGVNEAPETLVAQPHNYSVNENSTLTVAAPGFLSGDFESVFGAVQLWATVDSQPAHGTISSDDGGGFTYVPDSGYVGQDSFAFQVMDGNGDEGSASASITVNAFSNPPAGSPIYCGESVANWTVCYPPGVSLVDDGISNGTLTLSETAKYQPQGSDDLPITFLQTGLGPAATIALASDSVNNNTGSAWAGYSFGLIAPLAGRTPSDFSGSVFASGALGSVDSTSSQISYGNGTVSSGAGLNFTGSLTIASNPFSSGGLPQVFSLAQIFTPAANDSATPAVNTLLD